MSVFDAHGLAGTERYHVRRRVGAGGMGVVYEAYDRHDARPVALKTLGRVDANAIYRIKKEFRALSDVSHPNLVALHELVCHEKQWFFAMELIDGVDLLTWVRRSLVDRPAYGTSAYLETVRRREPVDSSWSVVPSAPFSEDEITNTVRETAPPIVEEPYTSVAAVDLVRVREAFGQLAEGLSALHDLQKVHRDIKPSNVLVTEAGRVVVLDFGLATELQERAMIQSSVQGLVCGTIAYMSPEQGAGSQVGPASDWYSMGVMLFEALTGRLPFEGKVYKVLVDKQDRDAPAPRDIVADIPEDLDDLCQRLLERDPEKRPRGDVVRRALGVGPGNMMTPAASWPAPPRRTPFVGRRRELDALAEAFAGLNKKQGTVVFLEGRSGMGKSALLKNFVDGLIEREEAVVLTGRCYERELVPYKAVDSLVDTLSRFLRTLPHDDATTILPRDIELLSRVFPVLQRVEAIGPPAGKTSSEDQPNRELRIRAFAAFRELLTNIATQVPLVVAIDDLHWGDADSGYLLAHLFAAPSPPPLLMVGTVRMEDRDKSPVFSILSVALKEQARTSGFVHIEVGPLDHSASRELALALMDGERVDGARRAARADGIASESGGNPLFVYELAAGALAEASTAHASLLVAAQENTPIRQLRLEHVLFERIRSLPQDARRLLEVIAAAAAPLPVTIANEAAGLHRGDRSAAMLLRTQRLVRTHIARDEEAVEVIHDRVRDAILNKVGQGVMRTHHQHLARLMLERPDPDPVALVIHLRESGDVDGAGRYAARAGRAAFDALAFDRAAELYKLGIELAPDVDANKNRAWLGEALAHAGRSREAAEAYLLAAESFDGSAALDLKRRAGEQLLVAGYVDRGLTVLEALLRDVGLRYPSTPERAMRSVTLWRAALAIRGLGFELTEAKDIPTEDLVRMDVCSAISRGCALVDMVRASYFGTKMLSLALAAGEPHRLVRALAFEVVLVGGIDRSTERVNEAFKTLQSVAKEARTPFATGLVAMARGFLAFVRGRWPEAVESLSEASTIFEERCSGAAWEAHTSRLIVSEALAHRGRLVELRTRVEHQLETADSGDNLYTATATRTYPLQSLVWLAADRPDEVRRQVEAARDSLSRRGYNFEHYAAQASLVQCDLYEGNVENAWARFSDEWRELEASLFMRVHLLSVSASDLYLRAALAAYAKSRDPQVLSVAKKRLEAMRRYRLRHVPGLAALHDGQIAVLENRSADAIANYERAAEAFDACDMQLLLAAASWRLAELLEGDRADQMYQDAREILAAVNVRRPERMVRVMAPVG